VPRITDFCCCMYAFGCKLSLVRLCDSDFGITHVDHITIGITCAAFCFHIANISFASSWYLFCLFYLLLLLFFFFLTEVETRTGRSVCDLLSAINCLSHFYKIHRRMSLQNLSNTPDFRENRLSNILALLRAVSEFLAVLFTFIHLIR